MILLKYIVNLLGVIGGTVLFFQSRFLEGILSILVLIMLDHIIDITMFSQQRKK